MTYKFCFYLLLVSINFCLDTLAQQKVMKVTGKILNGTSTKNVCFLNQEFMFLGMAKIINGQFEYSSYYDTSESPYFKIILIDKDSISKKDLIQNRLLVRELHTVYFGQNISLSYDVKTAKWSASGNAENRLHNAYIKNASKYALKIDSAYRLVDKEDLNDALKQEMKRKIKLTTFGLQRIEDVKLIEANPNSMVSLVEFWSYPFMHYLSASECRRIYNNFAVNLRNTPFGKRLNKRITDYEVNAKPVYPTPPKLNINDTMYTFTLNDLSGKGVKNTDIYEDYTLIDFWATWCIPCREEIPNIKLAASRFAKKGFKVIAISADRAEDIEKWKAAVLVEDMKDLVNLHNPYGSDGIAKELNITAIPANYLVDKRGTVIASNLRGEELMQVLEDHYNL